MELFNRLPVAMQLITISGKADLVAVNDLDKKALIAEVKRNPKNIRKSHLQNKATKLVQQLKGYDIEYRGFSLDDLASWF